MEKKRDNHFNIKHLSSQIQSATITEIPLYHFQKVLHAVLCLVAQLCLTFCNPTDCSRTGSLVRWDSPGKNTGGGCHALLQAKGTPQTFKSTNALHNYIKFGNSCPHEL